MPAIFIKNLYLFVLTLLLAVLEIQIEGPNGWAVNLPTWRPKPDSMLNQTYKKIMSGKEPTGYHLSIFLFLLAVLHGPFFFNLAWNWRRELEVWSLFFLIVVFWDLLWFILNPHYGLKKFKSVNVWWHNQWLGPWPIDYYWGIIASFLVYAPVMALDGQALARWFTTFVTFAGLTAIMFFLVELYKFLKKLK